MAGNRSSRGAGLSLWLCVCLEDIQQCTQMQAPENRHSGSVIKLYYAGEVWCNLIQIRSCKSSLFPSICLYLVWIPWPADCRLINDELRPLHSANGDIPEGSPRLALPIHQVIDRWSLPILKIKFLPKLSGEVYQFKLLQELQQVEYIK